MVDAFRGVPWQLEPQDDEPVTIQLEPEFYEDQSLDPSQIPVPRMPVLKRTPLRISDFKKFGFTPGCYGCRSIREGNPAQSHSEACRNRIEAKLAETVVGQHRMEQNTERTSRIMARHLQQQDMKRTTILDQQEERTSLRRGKTK